MSAKRLLLLLLLVILVCPRIEAQKGESYRGLLTTRVRKDKLAAPAHLKAYVENGKLRLSLRDAILLTLENDSDIQIEENQIEAQKFSLLAAFAPFDPLLQSSLNINRSSYSGYSQLQGVGESSNSILNTLSQTGTINYLQTFSLGTSINVGVTSSKSSTNSAYYYLNPYFSSSLNFQFTQPLLRNFGRFANTAQITIARRGLAQSHASFEGEVNDAILQVVSQYWAAVQARGVLDVQQRAQQLAETSFQRDKRALELGALPPLDISRSESEVASRKVLAIQATYALTQAEEALRILIGADQDPQFQSIGFDLTEDPKPAGDLEKVDSESLSAEGLAARPEIEAAKDALANDDTSIRLARNQLKPDLELNAFYQSNGVGGNQYNLLNGQLISSGGLASSYGQLFGFGYPGYGGTLTLNFPIRNRAAQSHLGTALVSRSHDLYSQLRTKEQIIREARNATEQMEDAKLALSASEVSLDLARKTLAADQRKFELGAETNFFVLDSQERLAQAELVLLQSQVNYQVALAAVGHVSGRLLAPYKLVIDAASK
jgi:outer membrane protein TolC